MKRFCILTCILLSTVLAVAQHHDDCHKQGNQHANQPPHEHYDAPPMPPAPPAATPEQMDRIIEYLSGISFDSDRLKAAQLIVTICPIYSHDLIRIISLFSFDDKRMEVLISAYPYCPDQEHFGCAVDKLSFSSNKETVYQRIGRR